MNAPTAYSGKQIFAVTLLFGVFAGGWLLASNYKILGLHKKENMTLSVCLGIFFTLVYFGLFVRSNNFILTLVIGLSLLFKYHFDRYQSVFIRAGIEKGGKFTPNWKVFVVGILSLPVTVFSYFVCIFLIAIPEILRQTLPVLQNYQP